MIVIILSVIALSSQCHLYVNIPITVLDKFESKSQGDKPRSKMIRKFSVQRSVNYTK